MRFITILFLSLLIAPRTADYQPITPANASQLSLVGVLGRGYVSGIEWVDEDTLSMTSQGGVWTYDANDLHTAPQWSPMPTIPDPNIEMFRLDSEWDTGLRPLSFDHLMQFGMVTFSHDNQFVVTTRCIERVRHQGCVKRDVVLFDFASRSWQTLFEVDQDDTLDYKFTFSEDDRVLVIADMRTSAVWDLTTQSVLFQVDEPWGILSPDGHLLATYPDGISLWSVADGQLRFRLTEAGYMYQFSPDSSLMATVQADYTSVDAYFYIHIWDTVTGEHIITFDTPLDSSSSIYDLEFSPDNQLLVTITWNYLERYSKELSTVKLWHIPTGELQVVLPNNYRRPAIDAAFSQDNHKLALARVDGTLQMLDTETGSILDQVEGFPGYHESVAFSPDGTIIVSGNDEAIWLWDVETQGLLSTLPGCSAFAFHNNVLACAQRADMDIDSSLKLLNVETGQTTVEFNWAQVVGEEHWFVAMRLTFSPDGSILASEGLAGNIHLWDTSTGELLTTLQTAADYVSSISFAQDGSLLISGPPARLWDVQSGELLAEIDLDMAWESSIAISPDGQWLAFPEQAYFDISGLRGDSGTVYVWHIDDVIDTDGAQIDEAVFSVPDGSFPGGSFAQLAFSPDSRIIAVLQEDLSLWDVETGEKLAQVRASGNFLAFSPDGTHIVTADGTCRICGADESFHLGITRLWGVKQ